MSTCLFFIFSINFFSFSTKLEFSDFELENPLEKPLVLLFCEVFLNLSQFYYIT